MCGIAGYLAHGGAPRGADVVLRMTRTLAARGPDDEGLALVDPGSGTALALRTEATTGSVRTGALTPEAASDFEHRVALGHRRFSIVDPSPRGHQPFWSPDGAVCLTFNGEVYNYIELRAELEAAGREFATTCDTEVLLAAYLEWGERCFERFVGFWALALYDGRRRAVLLARDRMGKAPLYLARHGGRLWWGSEIKALRAGAGLGAFGVREQAIADFVVAGLRDVHGRTFYDGIETFPRASWGWLGLDGSLATERYWELPRRRLAERELAPDEAAARLRETLVEALRVRLRADVPVGVELSGGVDSSSLVALAASRGQHLQAFTVSFPGTPEDEEPYARRVWERWRAALDYNVIEPEQTEFFDHADGFVAQMDEPFHSPSLLTNHRIWREMAERGLRVSINGAGGDELFCGYGDVYHRPFLADLLERRRLRRAGREAALYAEAPARPGGRLHRERVTAAASYALARRRGRARAPTPLGAGSHAAAAALLAGVPAPGERPAPAFDELTRELATDWLMSYWLRSGHQNFMAVPLEVRAPFLDHRVVELAFSLPATYLIRDGWLKWVVRAAVRDVLPPEVAFRANKMGFPFPLGQWLLANRETFFAAVGDAPCPHVPLDRLAAAYERLAADDPRLLWRAMSVSLWWRRCVVGEPLAAQPRAATSSS